MKKVININFQGRIIPIEETAFDLLKNYIESLRTYFSREEGRDEIINDIESRIAEIFSDKLKKGDKTCISDADVEAVMLSMGRPEDFEAADSEENTSTSKSGGQNSNTGTGFSPRPDTSGNRGKFFRSADDKVIAGVAGGLANYFKIDPVVVRIVFAVFFAALLWVYILLWIVVPSQSLQNNITRRLYRSAEDKMIGGVCGGLAAYFNIDTWIPRLVFALPIVFNLFARTSHWDPFFTLRILSGSITSTMIVSYIILWIAVPLAKTSSEKLEMKGEKVDLNSIRDTVKEDLGSLKNKAKEWSEEVKESAQQFSENLRDTGSTAGTQARKIVIENKPAARSIAGSFFNAIGVLIKAFVLFVVGVVVFALLLALIGILIGSFYVFPLSGYVLEGNWTKYLLFFTILLLIATPLVAIVVSLVRRLMGTRTKNKYLGWTFVGLWILGFVGLFWTISLVGNEFNRKERIEQEISIAQPTTGKLLIQTQKVSWRDGNRRFWNIQNDEFWNENLELMDSIPLNNVAVRVTASKDSSFHTYLVKSSRGRNAEIARKLAGNIQFNVLQNDSILQLPRHFMVASKDKFRNQQVALIIEVPVGKIIKTDASIENYDVFDIQMNRRGFNIQVQDDLEFWSDLYKPFPGNDYIMQPNGHLEMVNRLDQDALKKGVYKLLPEKEQDWNEEPSQPSQENQYRYKSNPDEKTTITDTVVAAIQLPKMNGALSSVKLSEGVVDGTVNLFSRFLEF